MGKGENGERTSEEGGDKYLSPLIGLISFFCPRVLGKVPWGGVQLPNGFWFCPVCWGYGIVRRIAQCLSSGRSLRYRGFEIGGNETTMDGVSTWDSQLYSKWHLLLENPPSNKNSCFILLLVTTNNKKEDMYFCYLHVPVFWSREVNTLSQLFLLIFATFVTCFTPQDLPQLSGKFRKTDLLWIEMLTCSWNGRQSWEVKPVEKRLVWKTWEDNSLKTLWNQQEGKEGSFEYRTLLHIFWTFVWSDFSWDSKQRAAMWFCKLLVLCGSWLATAISSSQGKSICSSWTAPCISLTFHLNLHPSPIEVNVRGWETDRTPDGQGSAQYPV